MAAAKKAGAKSATQDSNPVTDTSQVGEAQQAPVTDVAVSSVPVGSPADTGADGGNATASATVAPADNSLPSYALEGLSRTVADIASKDPVFAAAADLEGLQAQVDALRGMVLSLEMRFAELAQSGGIQFPALRNRGGIRRHTALMPLSMDKEYAAGDPVDVSEKLFADLKAAQVFEGEWEDGEPVDDED